MTLAKYPEISPPERTKIGYVKAQKQECINDVMLHDSKDYAYEVDGIYFPITKDTPIKYCFEAYRKVERPIEWWEDAAAYISSIDGCVSNLNDGKLLISGQFTHEKMLDLARILLEQEGE